MRLNLTASAPLQKLICAHYAVRVFNSVGSITSSYARLVVNALPPCSLPAGLISWWPGEGNALDVLGNNHGTLMNGAGFGAGMVGQGFRLDGVNDFVLISDNATLDLTNELTVELWYKSERLSGGEPLFDKRSGGGPCNYGAIVSSTYGIEVYYNDPLLNDGDFPGSGFEISALPPPVPAINVFHHFAATYKQTSSNQVELRTFVDGALVRTRSIQGSLARTVNGAPLSIGAEGAGSGSVFQGIIDEVSLYNRALAAVEIQTIYNLGSAGKCNTNSPPPPSTNCVSAAAGLAAWWPLDGNTNDNIGGNAVVLSGGPSFTAAKVDQGLVFDGIDDSGRVPANAALNLGAAPGLTIEMWINPSDVSSPNTLVEWSDTSSLLGMHFVTSVYSSSSGGGAGDLFANLISTSGNSHHISSSAGLLTANQFQHVALTYDKSAGIARLYLNGARVADANLGMFDPETRPDVYLGRRVLGGTAYRFRGIMDEVSLYSRSLSDTEILSIYAAGASGKCKGGFPPLILASPSSQTATVGDTVALSVSASGSSPLAYHWLFNGSQISDATNATLIVSNIQFSQAGEYAAVVANSLGSVTSAVAVLVLHLPPPSVRVVSATAGAGGAVGLPIQLLAQGNENALGFSLNFDPALLVFSSAELGANAPAGTTIFVNDTQVSAGRLGLAVGLPTGAAFNAGTQEIAVAHFTIASVVNAVTTPVTFGDAPTTRQIADTLAHVVAGTFTGGTISINAVDFEGDVALRPGGDRTLTIIDWVQMGRFAAGVDSPSSPGEFQRADCAPRATLGNGIISVSDVVQAGRYAVGLDPLTPIGGPTAPGGAFAPAGGARVPAGEQHPFIVPREHQNCAGDDKRGPGHA